MHESSRSTEAQYLERRFHALLGPLLPLMAADDVADVMVNPDGRVFVERVGEQIVATDLVIEPSQALALIKTLATMTGAAKVLEESPSLAARVPGLGWRFQGLVPPVVPAPTISLRKPASRVYPLLDYLSAGKLSPGHYEALREAVRERHNIIVVGGTGSGKTTLTNAILNEVALLTPSDRVIFIEDTEELRCASENHVAMKATRHISMHALLRDSLRMRPDRIIVGEVRGAEALVVLKAWNTGHPGGVTTLHANSARGGLDKIEKLAAEGTAGYVPRHEVAAAVQWVVYCERRSGNRRVAEVIKVNGLQTNGEYECCEV